jgi:DNA-3-methyladenine glycosylase II
MPSLPPVINTLDDLAACANALFQVDPRFKALHERSGLPKLRRRKGGLEGLSNIIVGQLISTKAANAIWARVEVELAPFDPADIAAIELERLAALGLTRAKAAAVVSAAKAELNGDFSFSTLEKSDDAMAAKALVGLRGVGRWTADIYLMTCLGRTDAWPAGDLAVRVGLQYFEGTEDIPAISDMDEHAEKWRPLRAVAARYLWDHYVAHRA